MTRTISNIAILFLLLIGQSIAQVETNVNDQGDVEAINISELQVENVQSLQFAKLMMSNDQLSAISEYDIPADNISLSDNCNAKGLANLDRSLKLGLAYDYKVRTKYDLGRVGTYLGVSKQVSTLLLALLSL